MNTFNACLAKLFGEPEESIPQFEGEDWWAPFCAWCGARGAMPLALELTPPINVMLSSRIGDTLYLVEGTYADGLPYVAIHKGGRYYWAPINPKGLMLSSHAIVFLKTFGETTT